MLSDTINALPTTVDKRNAMRIIRCDLSAVGFELGQSILDDAGRILLRAGVPLSHGHIRQLTTHGYTQILIRDGLEDVAQVREEIADETREVASMAIHRVMEQAGHNSRLALADVRHSVERILADITANAAMLVHLRTLRSLGEAVLTHSVNVAVLSLVVARQNFMDPVDMKSLGIGAMLHDIGKVYYHAPETDRSPKVPSEESAALRRHPLDGFELLRKQYEIDLRAAHVAFQHHERMDGSGFPRGLKGTAIHEWARIVAVADEYDNLTSLTPSRPALEPKDAVAELVRMDAAGKLDRTFVHLLVNRLALYPVGAVVEMESGHVGVVIGHTNVGQRPATLPRVRLLAAPDKGWIEPAEVLVSGESEYRRIRRTLPDYPAHVLAHSLIND